MKLLLINIALILLLHCPHSFGEPLPDDVLHNNRRDSDKRTGEDLDLQTNRSRRAANKAIKLWPSAVAYYYYSKDMGDDKLKKDNIERAMNFISDNTCVRFVENKKASNKFQIRKISNDCWTSYGAGRNQEIVLRSRDSAECASVVDVQIKNLMHILGFLPTLARKDRDDYVKIDSTQFKKLAAHFKYIADKPETDIDLQTPYEYGSVLHWQGLPDAPFTTKNELYQNSVGTNKATFLDMKMINLAYCKDSCNEDPNECKNGGYPNPNKCSVCNCPDGYGGIHCDRRPAGPGEFLIASNDLKSVDVSLAPMASEKNSTFNKANYIIIAPKGIEFQITSMDSKMCSTGCSSGGVEVNLKFPSISGFRACCRRNFLNQKFTTEEGDIIALQVYSCSLPVEFTFTYKTAGSILKQKSSKVSSEKKPVTSREESKKSASRKKTLPSSNHKPIELWPKATVNYFYSKEILADSVTLSNIKKAMNYIIDNTCVQFQENKKAKKKVQFKKTSRDCRSSYGAGSDQKIVITDLCGSTVDMNIRRLMHTLGFLPTLARKDRDNYVHFDNSELEGLTPYNKHIADKPETGIQLQTPYEYGSVLHLSGLSNVPFTTEDELYHNSVGTNKATFLDMKMINLAYCEDSCSEEPNECKNGGYPNPNKCSVCNCPDGYGGSHCDRRPSGPGEFLIASRDLKSVDVSLAPIASEKNSTFNKANYIIVAPKGIEFQITSMDSKMCSTGCSSGGVEVNLKFPSIAGFRVCCRNFLKRKFTTEEGDIIALQVYSRSLPVKFTFTYKTANRLLS